jgi:hypothetical protein
MPFQSLLVLLLAPSFSRDPFADIGRTVPERDSVRFVQRQEFHRITVDQLQFRELDRDDAAFLERSAKDFQVFDSNPPADAEKNTLFNRKLVDSAGHGVT